MSAEQPQQLVWQRFKLSKLGREAVIDYLKATPSSSDRALLAVIDEPYPLSNDAQSRLYRASLDASGRRWFDFVQKYGSKLDEPEDDDDDDD